MISISKQASKKSSRKAVCKRKIQARFTAFVMMRSSSSFHAGDTSHSPLSAHTLTHTHTKPPEETDTQRRNLCDSCYTKGRQVVRGESRQVEESPPPSRHRRSIQLRLWRARRTKKVSVRKNCLASFFFPFALRLFCVSLFRATGL